MYEGTGWHVKGSHTINYNSNSTGIAFIGDFSGKYCEDGLPTQKSVQYYFCSFGVEQLPTATALQMAKDLIQCGVELGEIDENYVLLGGRQVIASESPGLELYGDLQDWDHWTATP